MSSAIVCNANRNLSQRRKGKYVLQELKSLRARFGNAMAKQLRDDKKAMEEAKVPGDNTIYWMVHPDFPKAEARWLKLVLT